MIRLANKFDIPKIIQMLWNYHDSGKITGMSVKDDSTALMILTRILEPECKYAFLDQLLAVKSPYLWDNSKFVMREIAYWVEEEYRGGNYGYRLLKEYVNHCNELKEQGKICNYTMSQLEGQTLDYSRFGFEPVEQTWRV